MVFFFVFHEEPEFTSIKRLIYIFRKQVPNRILKKIKSTKINKWEIQSSEFQISETE